MAGNELERTRTDLTVPGRRPLVHMEEYPPGATMLHGDRADLMHMVRQGEVRAVGRMRQLPGGGYALPAVYVAKRHVPFYIRHRKALVITGSVLVFLSALAYAVIAVGPLVFFGGVFVAALAVAIIVRVSRGGGGRSVTVTTTTKVRVR